MFGNKFGVGVLKHPGYNGKGGGGGSQNNTTTGTTYTTNIPEYAQPYVENMLGATQQQLFKTDASGNISGFQPYTPYSTNMQDYIAPFSPLQQQAQSAAGSLSTPGQIGTGTTMAGAAGLGSLGAGAAYNRMATNPGAVNAFMNPYLSNVLDPQIAAMRRQYGITGQQQQSNATQQGAFGGSREALMASENNRAMNSAIDAAVGQGYNNAFNNAQSNMQYGANLGLQGMGQAGQAAATLGTLGNEQLAAQQGIIGTQAQQGATQQAQQQQMMNQSIQDYANAQQYPMMQLGMMSNMLRGLPMQGVTTQSYQAQPNLITQGIGALGTGYALQNAVGGTTKKAGGVINMAKGGIASFDVGGEVEHDLEGYPIDKLKEVAQTSQSERVREMARSILKDKTSFAPGGIIAFATGTQKTVGDDAEELTDSQNLAFAKQRAAFGNPTGSYSPSGYGLGKDFLQKVMSVGEAAAKPVARGIEHLINPRSAIEPGGYVPTAADKAKPTPDQAAATAAAMKGTPEVVDTKPAEEKPKKVVDTKTTYDPNAQPSPSSAYMPTTLTTEQGIIGAAPKAVQDYMNTAPEQQTMEQIMKQRADYLGPNTADAEYRKQIMESRANAADEAKRLESMRMAEFFSTWGSTPGPTLVAGMQAAQKTIPTLIADKKDQKKAKDESDKIIFELDRAARLEKAGNWDEAEKIKENQAKAAQNWTKAHMDVGMQASQNATGLEKERMSNVSSEKIAQGRNATDIKVAGMREAANPLNNKELALADKTWTSVYNKAFDKYSGIDPETASAKATKDANAALTPEQRKLLGKDVQSEAPKYPVVNVRNAK